VCARKDGVKSNLSVKVDRQVWKTSVIPPHLPRLSQIFSSSGPDAFCRQRIAERVNLLTRMREGDIPPFDPKALPDILLVSVATLLAPPIVSPN
jgi:hypothetical protein